ncbi:MAG: DEAD/DEAH box helicase [Candidatus Caenarcaniphilales bacterium]|nr:DEAD/DEAH box helicase [Candidatus Caenarcaniphilales bacterium]
MSITKTKFELDTFQKEAIDYIKESKSVIVSAPTGAGKTVIAKEAIRMALDEGKKVFYTAPLKALINQKFLEFGQEFGEDNVGILTGDTSKNRDAKVIVLTTEIYRNMLYETTFGSIDPYLDQLKFIIFDEFHYLGDESRGTVWEESIIYSPKDVSIVALSATINNPEEIQDWITEVHGECALVKTDYRPVPLHHFYFKEEQLLPLITPNKKLNPKLKERNDNRFGKKNKFGRSGGNFMKAASPDKVVAELAKKNMLPAIYFVFSRKGCDKYALECQDLDLLSVDEQKEINKIIDAESKSHSFIANYQHLDLIRKGVASHHSGLLPAVKLLIEDLFMRGLIKVVFSTETLAAGINMPAKTTVISSIEKRGDHGFRELKASEFLQMSGRAGRRGMDDLGYVVTVKSQNQTAADAAALAVAKAEDIESNFKASYEMVLNLLTNHDLKEIKELIFKSFGHSLVLRDLAPMLKDKSSLENKLFDLQTPLCPGEIGDLQHYKSLQDKLDDARKKKKKFEESMSPEVTDMEELLEILTLEAQNYPCNGCPKQKPCSKQMSTVKRFRKKVKDLGLTIKEREETYWQDFERIVALLKEKKYLDENNKPTELGKVCAAIRSENSFFITELVSSDFVKNLSVIEFACVLASVVIESRARDGSGRAKAEYFDLYENLKLVARNVVKTQRSFKVLKPVEVNSDIYSVVSKWMECLDWEELMQANSSDDGDALKALRRTLDICKQVSKLGPLDKKVKELAAQAVDIIEKEPVLEITT